jgi:ribose transport system substrate-binding protein
MSELSRRNFLTGAAGASIAATFGSWVLANKALAATTKAFAADSEKPGHKEMNLKVAFIMAQMAAQSDQGVVQGWNDWLDRKGYTKQWDAPLQDGAGNMAKVASMLEDAVSKKVDAIVLGFAEMGSLEGALQSVQKADIPLFTVDSGWREPSICDIASNNYLMGAQTGEYLIQRMVGMGKANGNIARITANFHHGTRKRGKVLTQILSENEGIKVLDERVILYQGFFEKSMNAVTDWLTQHGDKLDAVWCPWDEPAMAAAQAILQSGRTVKDCFVVGADGHIPAVNRMRDEPDYPMVATTSQSFPLWGNMVAYYVEQVVGLKMPVKEVVPVPIINLPTPLLVKGFNLPPADMPTWKFEDMYMLFMKQALGGVK